MCSERIQLPLHRERTYGKNRRTTVKNQLDSFQFAEEEVGTRLSVDPFHCLNDLDAFLPIVVTVYEEAEEKDPCFRPSMDVSGWPKIT